MQRLSLVMLRKRQVFTYDDDDEHQAQYHIYIRNGYVRGCVSMTTFEMCVRVSWVNISRVVCTHENHTQYRKFTFHCCE